MRRVVIVFCAALLLVPVFFKSRMNQDDPVRTAFKVMSSGRITVKVSGDVVHRGIYELSANKMAVDAIKMAMPLMLMEPSQRFAAYDRPLLAGSALEIAAQPDGSHLITVGQMAVSERLILKIPLEITSMSEADFDRLPGIGPALARRIVVYRQKNGGILRVEDLKSVDGIGEKKFEKLRHYFQHTVTKR